MPAVASGSLLFDRRCRLTIATPVSTPNDFKNVTTSIKQINAGKTDNVKESGLRVSFTCQKSNKKEPNTAEVKVYNLSETSRRDLQQKGVQLILEAGYKSYGLFRVFSGDVRTVDHVRNGADWETVFKLGDGERSFQHAKKFQSFAEGTPMAKVLEAGVKGLGIGLGNLNKMLPSIPGTASQGYAIAGSASKSVDKIVKALGMEWSVQDGEFQLLAKDGVVQDQVQLIDRDSGMVGSPEMGTPDKKGKPSKLTVKSLLIPMKPGQKVRIKSDRYDGFVRVVSCKLFGDTHGGDWYTEIQATLLKE